MSSALTYHSYIVAELDPEPAQVHGTGGPDYPRLLFSVRATMFPHGVDPRIGDELLFFTLRADLFIADRPNKVAETFQPFQYQSITQRHETQIVLDFPLDRYRVEKIEQARSGDLKIKICIQVASAVNGVPRFGG